MIGMMAMMMVRCLWCTLMQMTMMAIPTCYLVLPSWQWWWKWHFWWCRWRWWWSSPAICPCLLPPSCSSLNTRSLHLLWKPSQDSIQNTIYRLPDKVSALFRSSIEDLLYSVRDILLLVHEDKASSTFRSSKSICWLQKSCRWKGLRQKSGYCSGKQKKIVKDQFLRGSLVMYGVAW